MSPMMPDETFIPVEKDGAVILIHPLALQDHQRLGWKIVVSDEQPKPAEQPAEPVKKRGK